MDPLTHLDGFNAVFASDAFAMLDGALWTVGILVVLVLALFTTPGKDLGASIGGDAS